MHHHVNYIIIFIFTMFLATFNVSAISYTSTNNLFEGTYSNNLIDMAESQVKNFINKKFVIFQSDNNYYLVTGEDYLVNGNSITFTDSIIFQAYRSSGSYSYYDYTTYIEDSTTIYSDYIVISNIEFSKSISSKRFQDYWSDSYGVLILMVILGIVFAMFVSKEGRF